jgi:hypothetical protein
VFHNRFLGGVQVKGFVECREVLHFSWRPVHEVLPVSFSVLPIPEGFHGRALDWDPDLPDA